MTISSNIPTLIIIVEKCRYDDMEKIFINYCRFLSSTFPNLTSMIWMFKIGIPKNMKGKVT